MTQQQKHPECDRCGNELIVYEVSYSHVAGKLPTLYGGVLCTKCGKTECMKCKSGPAERPCSWCGYPVVPVDDEELARSKKRRNKESKNTTPDSRSKITITLALVLVAVAALIVIPLSASIGTKYFSSPDDIPDPQPILQVAKERQRAHHVKREPFPGTDSPQIPHNVPQHEFEDGVNSDATSDKSPHVADPELPQEAQSATDSAGREYGTDPFELKHGDCVKITFIDGRYLEGYITEISEDTIKLQQNYRSGSFSYSFAADEMESFFILSHSGGNDAKAARGEH